jgi:hypothetical protein
MVQLRPHRHACVIAHAAAIAVLWSLPFVLALPVGQGTTPTRPPVCCPPTSRSSRGLRSCWCCESLQSPAPVHTPLRLSTTTRPVPSFRGMAPATATGTASRLLRRPFETPVSDAPSRSPPPAPRPPPPTPPPPPPPPRLPASFVCHWHGGTFFFVPGPSLQILFLYWFLVVA